MQMMPLVLTRLLTGSTAFIIHKGAFIALPAVNLIVVVVLLLVVVIEARRGKGKRSRCRSGCS